MTLPLTFATVCTGVGAADVAFTRQGYRHLWMCEIDKACRTVLRRRFPGVPIHEDMTTLETSAVDSPNVLAGGTPCQGFSIAGQRLSLADQRSNLCLRFIQISNELDPGFICWENVPGCLSTEDNAFGCFLAGLSGADAPLVHPDTSGFASRWGVGANGKRYPKWPRAGVVVGPRRTVAWRVLDSQFFGVAQRRECVFVIASPHTRGRSVGLEGILDDASFYGVATKILFESEMLRRHSPPSREKREDVAATLGASPEGSGWRSDVERMTFVPSVAPPLGAHALSKGRGTDLDNTTYVATHDVSPALQERGNKGADSDCIQAHVIVSPLTTRSYADNASQEDKLVVHGFDKGRGEYTGEDLAGTLRCNEGKTKGVNSGKPDNQCVAFRAAGQDGFDPQDVSPPLAATDGGGAGVPTAFYLHSQNSEAMNSPGPGRAGAPADVARALDTNGGYAQGQGGNVVVNPKRYQVRRLTPVECERLQAFEDDHTRYGLNDAGKEIEQKDSPRYRQLGNAWTTFVADWLAMRIKKFGYKL